MNAYIKNHTKWRYSRHTHTHIQHAWSVEVTSGHIRNQQAANRLFKPCCRRGTAMLTAPLQPERLSPIMTPDVQDFTVWACVSVGVKLLNRYARWFFCAFISKCIISEIIPSYEFSYCYILCVWMRKCGCVSAEEMLLNSMRCYLYKCLNTPSLLCSLYTQRQLLYSARAHACNICIVIGHFL